MNCYILIMLFFTLGRGFKNFNKTRLVSHLFAKKTKNCGGGVGSRVKHGVEVDNVSIKGMVDDCVVVGGMSYTTNQKSYIKALNDPLVGILLIMGTAGTGKTFIGCQEGLNNFLDNKYKKIIITRPLIPVSGEELGFLPGSINQKMQPWTQPIYDAFLETNRISKMSLDKYVANMNIEIIPLAFMRGRTFKNAFIFADEMQNSTPEQLLMLLTRIGEGSKLIIAGDLNQSDMMNSKNGLKDFMGRIMKLGVDKFEKGEMRGSQIKIIQFGKEDIKRSIIIENVLRIYE